MFKKNTKLIITVLVIGILVIIFSYFYNKFSYKENFGYDDNPSEFIEPKIYPNIISAEEAKYILEQSNNKFEDSVTLGGYDNSIRKSKTCWLKKEDNVIKNIVQKVCNIGNYKFENVEDLQVVKYEPNGYYNEHHDSCCDDSDSCKNFIKRGGNRVLTMVIYLNDGFEGGSTRFINLDKNIKPEKHSGILFFPMNKKGDKCHTNSLHAGLPITSGEKYIANVWIRESKFE